MKKLIGLLLVLLFSSHVIYADWVQDSQFKFKINVPFTWQKNSFNDGTDRVHVFLSPDENLAIRIRAFEVNSNVSLELVESLFRTNILGECEQLALINDNINGYNGKIGAYRGVYNGNRVGAAAFYTIQNGIAYIVWSLTPIHLFDSKINESDAITNTFTIMSSNSYGLVNTFRDASLGYRINYPANWIYTKTKPHIVIFSGKQGTSAYYSTINIQNLASASLGGNFNSINDVENYFKNQLYAGAQNVSFSHPEQFEIQSGGRNILGSVYEIKYYRQNQNFKQVLVILPRYDNQLYYAWMYTSSINDYDTYYSIAMEMLDTWLIE